MSRSGSCVTGTFSDLDEDVRQSFARIKAGPFVPY